TFSLCSGTGISVAGIDDQISSRAGPQMSSSHCNRRGGKLVFGKQAVNVRGIGNLNDAQVVAISILDSRCTVCKANTGHNEWLVARRQIGRGIRNWIN
ncbi:MAG: hypothetical protein AAEJ43_11610, partial [Gammaproteobacteria bacterium]